MIFIFASACAVLSIVFGTGCHGFQWTSDLPNGTVKYACVGDVLELPWNYKTSPGDDVLSIEWLFEGASQEMIGFFSHGNFAPMASFINRAHHGTGAGLSLSNVTTGDTGQYTVEISGHDASGMSFTYRHSVMVHVMENDKLMTTDGQLHAILQPEAVYSSTTDQWSLVLSCGNFTYSTDPPFDMEWLTPSKAVPLQSSNGYKDGYFNLHVTSGGDYTCRVPLRATSDVCLRHSNPNATLHVDIMETRLTLMEARQGQLQKENKALRSEVDVLKTRRCETGGVLLYPSSQHATTETIDGLSQEVKRHTKHVTFSRQFSSTPYVAVSLAEIDSNQDRNLRIVSGASAISLSGFDVYVYQWGDTGVTKAMARWMACN